MQYFGLHYKTEFFFCSPTNKYATTILIINGVKTDPKKDITTKNENRANENIIVSSLLNIFLNNVFNCSNIYLCLFLLL